MRAVKIILSTILCLSLVGCGNKKSEVTFNTKGKTEKASIKQKKQIKKAEKLRFQTDAVAWKSLTEDYNNLKEEYEENKEKSLALLIDYYTGIYKIAYSRIQNDSEYSGAYDDGYLEYLALLQTFCEYYESDIQTFYNQLNEGDTTALGSNLLVAEKAIENLYNSYYTGETLNTSKSASTKSKTKKKNKAKNKKSNNK